MIESPVNGLEKRARALVVEKDAFDESGKNYKKTTLKEIVKNLFSGMIEPQYGWTSVHPGKFIKESLPYSDTGHDKEKAYVSMVPSNLAISGTYKNYSPCQYFQPRSDNELMDWSDGLHDSAYLERESLRVTKIGGLPLFIVTEGKNRVMVFKRNNRPMKALITDACYPSPDELVLHRSFPFSKYSLQCGRERKILPFPDVVVPLLQEYGVTKLRVHFSIWDLVRFARVRRELCKCQMRS